MKICIIGGHLAPALALLDYVPREWDVVFIGRKHVFEGDVGVSLEYQTITTKGITFYPLITGRLQRKLTRRTFGSLPKISRGYMQSLIFLRKENPDVVVGFGGYLSLTVALAARTLGIPVVIHEQTLQAGLANRIIGRFAKHICISWESSRKYFPKKKIVLTGNLLRKALSESFTETKKNGKTKEMQIYITGGSAGAHAINLLVEQSLPRLLEKYILIHQTGDAVEFGDYARLSVQRSLLPDKLQKRYLLTKFIDPTDVGKIYAESDLVIGRSGVNTMTELLITHKPCLLIPIPHGQRNEQMDNAIFLKDQGLATILPQEFATAESFYQAIEDMIEKLDQIVAKKNLDMSLHLHAAEHLVQLLQSDYEKETGEKPQTRTKE